MSTPPRLVFESVTKSFRDRTAPRTLRDAIPSAVGMLLGRGEPQRTRFVAVENMSFEVAEGEALGLIGRNGAGKSTSLKLAAGVYRPDSGEITVRGSVASMIELSAGFHPDLSGRENVFLNAALLGLRRKEIQALMPKILEFADIGEFVEAPLRVYSSGMTVRLGFAVASHVPAQVLLVDEVLAVGDLDFRTRCLQRMSERRRDGVSVLFVSHNLATMERFCDRILVVDGGQKLLEGEPSDVVGEYRRMMLSRDPAEAGGSIVRHGTGEVRIERVEVVAEDGGDVIQTGRPFCIRLHMQAASRVPPPTFGVELTPVGGTRVIFSRSHGDEPGAAPVEGAFVAEAHFDEGRLLPGVFDMTVWVRDREDVSYYDCHRNAHRVQVVGKRPRGEQGVVDLGARWVRPE